MNFDSATGEIVVTCVSQLGVGWRHPDGSDWGTAPKSLALHPSRQEDYHALAYNQRASSDMYDLLGWELSRMDVSMVEKAYYNSGGNHFFNPDPGNQFTMDNWESLMCAIRGYPDCPLWVAEDVYEYWLMLLSRDIKKPVFARLVKYH